MGELTPCLKILSLHSREILSGPLPGTSSCWTLPGYQMRPPFRVASMPPGLHPTLEPGASTVRARLEGKASLGLHLRRLGTQWNWLKISISQPLSWGNTPPCVRILNESMIIARQKLCTSLVQKMKKKNQCIYYGGNCSVYNSLLWLKYNLHKELNLKPPSNWGWINGSIKSSNFNFNRK